MSAIASSIQRPSPSEYDPYYERYISLVKSDDIVSSLQKQGQETLELLGKVRAERGEFRYAPGKWSVKEVLGHINDTERIMSYRVLRIARGDRTPIEGFEQDDYIAGGKFWRRAIDDLLQEFATIRNATVQLVRHLDAEAAERHGTANNKEISARAIVYVIAGHELHHRRILQEKYLY
ncbi:MAG TPA: DinB family protein [Terriglobales bacterium]|nr:DinB family protein [Terriglobales bacterium]